MNRAVFLDRDNTIIHNDGDLGDPEEVRLIQGAATAIASLCGLGYKIIVVTNQGGVARGKYTEDDVLLVHERIDQLIRESANGARIDRFYYCPYHPEGTVEAYRCEHPSRKPSPGMLLEAAEDMNLDLAQSWTIGDQVRDVQAGAAAGTRTILLRNDADLLKPIEPERLPVQPGDPSPATHPSPRPEPPDYIVRTLTEAVRVIAHARRPEAAEHLHHAHVVGKRFDAAAVAKLQRPRTPQAEREEAPASPRPRQPAAPPEPATPRASEGSGGTGGRAGEARRTSGKPFRPWAGMPGDEEGDDQDRAARVRARFRKLREQRETGHDTAEAPDAPETPDSPDAPDAPAPARSANAGTAGIAEDQAIAPDTAAAAGPASGGGTATSSREPSPPWASIDQTLRLILQELRSQRGTSDDFSYLYVVAIVLQMVAGLCLVGGLWMGSGDDALFLRWIGAGLMVQFATVAALLFSR